MVSAELQLTEKEWSTSKIELISTDDPKMTFGWLDNHQKKIFSISFVSLILSQAEFGCVNQSRKRVETGDVLMT